MKTYGGAKWIALAIAVATTGAAGAGCGGGGSGSRATTAAQSGGTGTGGTGGSTPTTPSTGGGGTAPTTTSSSGGGSTAPTTTSSTGGGGSTAPTTTSSTGGTGGTGSTPPTTPAPDFSVTAKTIGTNLNAVSYYTPEWPFVDIMKSSRVLPTGFPWDLLNPNGLATPALDAQGYPKGLGSGQVAFTYAMRGIGSHFPAGTYVVLFEGDGAVEVLFPGGRATTTGTGSGTARGTLNVTAPSGDGFTIRITRSNATNHVRNLRIIMPGFEATYATQPFHPLFLERLKPFSVLRFMDWGATNDSDITTWSQRKLPDYRSMHSRGGVAYEVMADLCNLTQKQLWVCIPHKANDDYVRQLATLLRDRVDPKLKVFVEYSNEVWNGGFQQYHDVNGWASAKGQTWYVWYAQRSVSIFKTFEQVFGGTSRLVRVIGSQHGNAWIGKQILAATPAGAADVLAIAPYFGNSFGSSGASTARTWTVDQLLDACANDLAKQRDLMRANKAQAKAAGVELIAYEGGQHLAGVGNNANDETLTALFIAANRHSRMKQIYKDYLAAWAAEGGGTFVHFSYIYVPQKWGSWGSLEYQDQALSTAHKYQALVETIQSWAP
jgi:hypothetical protein